MSKHVRIEGREGGEGKRTKRTGERRRKNELIENAIRSQNEFRALASIMPFLCVRTRARTTRKESVTPRTIISDDNTEKIINASMTLPLVCN